MTTTRCATAPRAQDDQHRDGDSYQLDPRTRDFDYGVGDEVAQAVERTRTEVARWIRQAAQSLPSLTAAEWSAYERAAAIAEQGGCRSTNQPW